MYMPKADHGQGTFHSPWQTSYFANSEHGAIFAASHGFKRVDNDYHFTRDGKAWGRDHGAPLNLFFPMGDRMEKHDAADVFARRRKVHGVEYQINTAGQGLAQNAKHGVDTEFEVKDVRPYATAPLLDAGFARVANHAKAAYGPNWHDHLIVKVLTDLGGGERYALDICAHAHAHDIPTMLLVRGDCVHKNYAGHTEVTFVRGSAVIR